MNNINNCNNVRIKKKMHNCYINPKTTKYTQNNIHMLWEIVPGNQDSTSLSYRPVHLPVRMLWKAVSTLVESRAEVSMKDSPSFSANALASSVGTDRRWRKSDLLPATGCKLLSVMKRMLSPFPLENKTLTLLLLGFEMIFLLPDIIFPKMSIFWDTKT